MIDLVILVVVLTIMHKSTAFWPIWFAGFHTIIVATGLAQFVFPDAITGLYVLTAGFWSLPSLLVLVLGTLADYKTCITAASKL